MWPHVITFDCYGTLVQWPETLQACFRDLLPASTDIVAFHRTFTACHTRLRTGPYQPYSQLLRQSLREALATWGYPPVRGHWSTSSRCCAPSRPIPTCQAVSHIWRPTVVWPSLPI